MLLARRSRITRTATSECELLHISRKLYPVRPALPHAAQRRLEIAANRRLRIRMDSATARASTLRAASAPVGIPAAIHLLRNVDQLKLSVRTSLCLKNENIRFIGELVQRSEAEMLRVPNFGRKSLNELKEVLAQIGMPVENQMRTYSWCNPPRIGRQRMRPALFTVRAIGGT
jgi:ribosomal protein L37E